MLLPAPLARISLLAIAPLLLVAANRGMSQQIVKGDHENYTRGPFLAYAAPWSTATLKSLRQNVDFADHVTINPAEFPKKTQFDWHWPLTPAPTGVYGYVHVSYGNYNNGVPEKAVSPLRLSGLTALSTDYAYRYTAKGGDFNVLAELFTTNTPGNANDKVLEIGFFPRVSASGLKYFNTGRQLGQWTDPQGVTWRVAIAKAYCMFLPVAGEQKAGTIDFKAALGWLVDRGELSGREWVNGVAIGVEPIAGGGNLMLDRWNVSFR